MTKEDNRKFSIHFTEEFNKCLDQIQAFFSEQGEVVLEWWFSKEDNMIDEIDHLLSSFPYAGKMVEQGPLPDNGGIQLTGLKEAPASSMNSYVIRDL